MRFTKHFLGVALMSTASLLTFCTGLGAPDDDDDPASFRSRRPPADSVQSSVIIGDGGDGGYCMEQFWDGGYNICNHNCHHAASEGVAAGNDGIVSCDGTANGSLGGHTINWDRPAPGVTCVAEPQLGGSCACCWNDNSSGTPDLSSGEAAACAAQVCGSTTCNGEPRTPIALPEGDLWDFSKISCSKATGPRSCAQCCDSNAAIYSGMVNCDGENVGNQEPYASQVTAYKAACKAACTQRFLDGGSPPGDAGSSGGSDAGGSVDAGGPDPCVGLNGNQCRYKPQCTWGTAGPCRRR